VNLHSDADWQGALLIGDRPQDIVILGGNFVS